MASVVAIDKDAEPSKTKTPAQWQKYWTNEVTSAEKRLRKFYKQGNKVVQRYTDNSQGGNRDVESNASSRSSTKSSLNLFHTNVKTQLAMLYGSVPKIDVSREHHDPDDDVARVAAFLYQRILQADVDPSGKDLPAVLRAALQDRLLPGLGVARVRYEVETEQVSVLNPETMDVEKTEQMVGESVPVDYVHWQDFLWGWCRTWDELPWMGFKVYLDKDECVSRFGAKITAQLDFKNQLPGGTKEQDGDFDKDMADNIQKAEILEIWSMREKRVFWWAKGLDKLLDTKEDPLGLDGFWPIPKPLMANTTTTLMIPTADFVLAQDLYNQIDELNTRIIIITRAIKVVGVYDKAETASVGRMLKEGVENDMIPVDNWAMFAEKGGLQGSIQWFPVQEIVGVLQTLKQVLSETIAMLDLVTGMSDIMKGGTGGQYTAASSNQLAAKTGSIVIQSLQEEFARFASDLEALKAEVISKHYSPDTIYRDSNAGYIPKADQDKVQPAIQLMQEPDLKWRVDIRPESIAMIDYAQLKQERTEFLTAMATYIQSATSAVAAVPGSLPVLLEMLKWGMAGFKGSNVMEGTMDQAIEMAQKAPPPGQDDGKAKEDEAKAQAKMAEIQAKSQAELQKIQAKAQADTNLQQQKFQMEMQKENQSNQNKLQQEMASHQSDMKRIQEDLRADLAVIMQKLSSDLQVEKAQAQFNSAEEAISHDNKMSETMLAASLAPEPSVDE